MKIQIIKMMFFTRYIRHFTDNFVNIVYKYMNGNANKATMIHKFVKHNKIQLHLFYIGFNCNQLLMYLSSMRLYCVYFPNVMRALPFFTISILFNVYIIFCLFLNAQNKCTYFRSKCSIIEFIQL